MMSSPHVKRIVDGKLDTFWNDHGVWSTAEQFASSFLTSTGSDLHLHPECPRSQLDWTLTEVNKPTHMPHWCSELAKCFTVRSIVHGLPCHSKWQHSIRIYVHCLFHIWLCEVSHKVYSQSSLCEVARISKYWNQNGMGSLPSFITRPCPKQMTFVHYQLVNSWPHKLTSLIPRLLRTIKAVLTLLLTLLFVTWKYVLQLLRKSNGCRV